MRHLNISLLSSMDHIKNIQGEKMKHTKTLLTLFGILTVLSFSNSFAEETEIIPLNANMAIEKTTLKMNISSDNELPWAFVEGKIENPVSGYPVIIQIFDNDDQVAGNSIGAVLFAQTDVTENGTYEYRFRVLDKTDGEINRIFEGEYTVKIFKVVYQQINEA